MRVFDDFQDDLSPTEDHVALAQVKFTAAAYHRINVNILDGVRRRRQCSRADFRRVVHLRAARCHVSRSNLEEKRWCRNYVSHSTNRGKRMRSGQESSSKHDTVDADVHGYHSARRALANRSLTGKKNESRPKDKDRFLTSSFLSNISMSSRARVPHRRYQTNANHRQRPTKRPVRQSNDQVSNRPTSACRIIVRSSI